MEPDYTQPSDDVLEPLGDLPDEDLGVDDFEEESDEIEEER